MPWRPILLALQQTDPSCGLASHAENRCSADARPKQLSIPDVAPASAARSTATNSKTCLSNVADILQLRCQ
jgi:hypothetical protein